MRRLFICDRPILILSLIKPKRHKPFTQVVDDLHPAEDGEASEEPHGATDESKSCFHCYFNIFFNLVICCCRATKTAFFFNNPN